MWSFHTKNRFFSLKTLQLMFLVRQGLTIEAVLAVVITQGCMGAVVAKFQLFRRWRLGNREFKVILGYMANLRPA